MAEGVQTSIFIEREPISDGFPRHPQEASDLLVGIALIFEEQTVQPFSEADILFGFVAPCDLGAFVFGKGEEAFHANILPDRDLFTRR